MNRLNCQDYSIVFGSSPKLLTEFLVDKKYSHIIVLVDENSLKYCFPKIEEALEQRPFTLVEISSGEDFKNLETCQDIYSEMLEAGADRKSLMINLGGGVIGDMGGFCASTYMRGIDFIQIPTTLLSQVDSSVGGKLGVDLHMTKNIVGLFNSPQQVLIDRSFLDTLSEEQLVSGFAEMIKHGLIADADLYDKLKALSFGLEPKEITEELIRQAILVKKEVVENDPYEQGLRKILNYGHTIGHAVETESWNFEKPLLHGEAILIGMICENHIAFQKGILEEDAMNEINAFLKSVFYRNDVFESEEMIFSHMKKDKKNRNNQIFIALIDKIASAIPATIVSEEEVLDSLSYYKNM